MKKFNVLAVVSIDFEVEISAESHDDALQLVSEMDFSEVKPHLADYGFQGVTVVDAEER